jgi:hypothetical protein
MASFLSGLFGKLFGGGEAKPAPRRSDKAEDYKGYTIHPLPQSAGGQWRLAGRIVRSGEGVEEKEAEFVRADTFPSQEEAETFSLRKGRQIIDERGDNLFSETGVNRRL